MPVLCCTRIPLWKWSDYTACFFLLIVNQHISKETGLTWEPSQWELNQSSLPSAPLHLPQSTFSIVSISNWIYVIFSLHSITFLWIFSVFNQIWWICLCIESYMIYDSTPIVETEIFDIFSSKFVHTRVEVLCKSLFQTHQDSWYFAQVFKGFSWCTLQRFCC